MPPTPPLLHATLRGQTMAQIQSCRACDLASEDNPPITFRGSTPNRVMIVAPSPTNMQLLRRLFDDFHLPSLTSCFLAWATCCYDETGGKVEEENIRACLPNLRAQVRLCDPEWVVLLGASALYTVGYLKEKVGKVHGRPFEAVVGPYIGRKVFPMYHPGAGGKDEEKMVDIKTDLSTLRGLLDGTMRMDMVSTRIGGKGTMVL